MKSLHRQRGDTTGLVIFAVLVVMLLISIAGNAYFWHERDKLLQKEATVTQMKDDIAKSAQQCTASVDRLAKDGKARDKRIEGAMARIAPSIIADQKASFAALQAQPDNPKDLCGSLDRFRRKAEAEDKARRAK
jgi:uncharacterized protein HemX